MKKSSALPRGIFSLCAGNKNDSFCDTGFERRSGVPIDRGGRESEGNSCPIDMYGAGNALVYTCLLPLYNACMQRTSRVIFWAFLLLLGIALLALLSSALITRSIDRTQRELLLVQTKQAAILVGAQDIASLSGSDADLSNPLYQSLKSKLVRFREANPDIRFVYLMGYRPDIDSQFFYVDSEPTTSDDYSPPGQLFPDATKEDIERYHVGEPFTEGPFKDSWGEWVSGSVPIRGESGRTVAMMGIDIATEVWHAQIAFARTAVIVIALLVAVLALTIFLRMYRKQSSIAMLSTKNRKLEKSALSLRELASMAHVGSIKMYFPERSVLLDEQFHAIVKPDESGRVAFDALCAAVHPDDRARLEGMVAEIETSDIVYAWADVRIGSPGAGYRTFHLYGNIKRHVSGGPERFDGIMQDITDIEH